MKRLLSLLLASIALALLIQTGSAARQPGQFFYSSGRRVAVRVIPNAVAIKAEPGLMRSTDLIRDIAAFDAVTTARMAALDVRGLSVVPVRSGRAAEFRDNVKLAGQVESVGLVAEIGPAGPNRPLVVITPEFIVRFGPNVTRGQIDELNRAQRVAIVRADPFVPNQFVLHSADENPERTLPLSVAYVEQRTVPVELAHPNFIAPPQSRGPRAVDPLLIDQWHLQLIRAADAWRVTQGEGVVIALIDQDGVEVTHEDLVDNRFVNAGEIPDNQLDDDHNGFVDDVSGWNFERHGNDPTTTGAHGTAAAAVAAARCDNGIGGCGVAPKATILGITLGTSVQDHADAIRYAHRMGARVISNSWGYEIGVPSTQVVEEAISEVQKPVGDRPGSIVVFAMTNEKRDNFGGDPDRYGDVSSLPGVFAIGRSTDADRWGHSGYGNGMAVLGPTSAAKADATHQCLRTDLAGVREVTTADLTGAGGINRAGGAPCGCNPGIKDLPDTNYTRCFGGTSSATPLVAGVIALMLSVNPRLSADDVRDILATTSVRIEPALANYQEDAHHHLYSTTHGFGRVDALSAVELARQTVAPRVIGGRTVGPVSIPIGETRQDAWTWDDFVALQIPPETSEDVRRAILAKLDGVGASASAAPYRWTDRFVYGLLVIELKSPWTRAISQLRDRLSSMPIRSIGRLVFPRSDVPEAELAGRTTVLLNRFSLTRAAGANDADVVREAAAQALTVEPRADGRYLFSPKDVFRDPLLILDIGKRLAEQPHFRRESLAPEFVPQIQARGAHGSD